MTYKIKKQSTLIFAAIFAALLLTACGQKDTAKPVTLIKNSRASEKHPVFEAPKEKQTLNQEVTKDSFKEIARVQNVKLHIEDTTLPLTELKNSSGKANSGIIQNKEAKARQILSFFKKNNNKKRPLRIAYFNPSDRKAVPDYQQRIQKIMTELKSFYAKGMKLNGFGTRTFDLEMNNKKLLIHFIQSSEPKKNFARNGQTSKKIHSAVSKKLKEKGINIEEETVIVFQNLARIENNSFYDTDAPYFGSWHTNVNRKGFCYVVDSEFLNWNNLKEKTKKFSFNGQRSMTLGELASGQIGGVCHELGHAFCLNHTCDSHKISSKLGTALMGYGNWTFKEELRQKGKGTYMSFVSAVKLMGHPCFSALSKATREFQITDLSFNSMNGILDIHGQLHSNPDVYSVIAYCDNLSKRSDYDATGWVGSVNNMGNFQITINELKKSTPYKLNLQFLHTNGDESTESIEFKTSNLGKPIIAEGQREKIILKPLIKAKLKNQEELLKKLTRNLESYNKQKSISFLSSSIKLIDFKAKLKPSEVLKKSKSIYLSQTKWSKAFTGYNSPINNSLHEDNHQSPWPFLTSATKLHRFGLYAHANSEYTYELNGKWKKLTGACSLRKGMKGSVIFIIKGDGKELFNSGTVNDSRERNYSIDLKGINNLQLIVNDSGNGKNSDWGQWLSPKLSR